MTGSRIVGVEAEAVNIFSEKCLPLWEMFKTWVLFQMEGSRDHKKVNIDNREFFNNSLINVGWLTLL